MNVTASRSRRLKVTALVIHSTHNRLAGWNRIGHAVGVVDDDSNQSLPQSSNHDAPFSEMYAPTLADTGRVTSPFGATFMNTSPSSP